MPTEYPDTWEKLLRMFQWQRLQQPALIVDHERLDMIESVLYRYAQYEARGLRI